VETQSGVVVVQSDHDGPSTRTQQLLDRHPARRLGAHRVYHEIRPEALRRLL
jgi:hypothetical protein